MNSCMIEVEQLNEEIRVRMNIANIQLFDMSNYPNTILNDD